MGVFKKEKALTAVAKEPKKEPTFILLDYPGLRDLYEKRDDLKRQKNEIRASKDLLRGQIISLSRPELDDAVDELLSGKREISQVKADAALKKSRQLEDEVSSLNLRESVLDKAIERVKSEITGVESKAREMYKELATALLNQHAVNIKAAMETFLDEHQKVSNLHRTLQEVGVRLPGNTWFTGYNVNSLKPARSKLEHWWAKALLGG
jgi:vacuolar-type H+-ATPase subunit E/Vma4